MAALDLETLRLRLAPFRTDEAGLLHQLWMEPGVRRHLWDDQVIPPEQTAEIVAKSEELFRRHGYGLWSLRLRETAEPDEAGSVWPEQATGSAEGVHTKERRRASLSQLLGFAGYWFFREPPELEFIFGVAAAAWGQGLAVEAGRELLRYAFEDLGFSEVRASTDVANRASVRALEKLGLPFERRSTIQGLDTLFYSLRREDWVGGV